MKIFDTFIFGGHGSELDLLEIRLNELYEVVDKFVIVESPTTHSTIPKKLYYNEHKGKFAKFADKIIYYVTQPLLYKNNLWYNENAHRNAIKFAIDGAELEDWILLSDLDEIPSKESVAELKYKSGCVCVGIPLQYRPFYVNVQAGMPTVGSRAIRYSYFITKSPQDFRNDSFNSYEYTKNIGWHFTYQGGVDAIKEKLVNFAHANDYDGRLGHHTKETSLEEIARDLENLRIYGEHPISKDWKITPFEDTHLPKFIKENKEKFITWLL